MVGILSTFGELLGSHPNPDNYRNAFNNASLYQARFDNVEENNNNFMELKFDSGTSSAVMATIGLILVMGAIALGVKIVVKKWRERKVNKTNQGTHETWKDKEEMMIEEIKNTLMTPLV